MAALAPARGSGTKLPHPLVLTALTACLLAPLLVATGAPAPVRLPAVLVFFCTAPGVALLTLARRRGAPLEIGLVVGLSLAAMTLVATGMVLTGAWHTEAATYVVAVVCLAALVRELTARHGAVELLPSLSPFASPRRLASLLYLGEGVGVWILTLHSTNLHRISGLGLLNALPLSYYAAVILLVLGFVLALSERTPSRWLLAAHVVALVFVLHGTTAILYPEPRYTWMYKHLGVIDYIQRHGSVDRHVDLYHNWPGFFALNAWFGRAAGVTPISYAAWAQVFFELLTASALLFTLRALSANVRQQWATVWLFLVGDWVGQNYFAPQAISFALVVLTFGIFLRAAPFSGWRDSARGRRLRRALARLVDPARPRRESTPITAERLGPDVAMVVGGICASAVIVSHQLSPVMLILGLAALCLATAHPPVRVVAGLVALEAAWVAWTLPYLGGRISLVSIDLFPNARPSGENFGRGLPGVSMVAAMPKVVLLAMLLLAAAGTVSARRAGRLDLRVVVLLVAPIPFIPFQAYGGEILQRAFLFELPWLAYLAAMACVRPPPSGRFRLGGVGLLAPVSLLIVNCTLFAYFGLEKIAYVTRDDIAAVEWYERTAPAGSVMAYGGPGLPDRILAEYARLKIRGDDYVPQLTDMRQLRTRSVRGRDIPAIADYLRAAPAERTYLAITPSMRSYARLYGLTPKGSLAHLASKLKRSTRFRLVYQHGNAFVFQLVPERGR
jgi:hypothetical protein